MIELILPFPPSINHYWKHRHIGSSVYISAEGMRFQQNVAILARNIKSFGNDRLSINIDLYAPTRRKYDIDNRIKAALDALTKAGLWDDDEQIDELTVRRCEIKKGGELKILIKRINNV
jgi:crossover junction endodeoxyribonuclease RusA